MTIQTIRSPFTVYRSLAASLCALSCALSGAQQANAQAYPAKPVRVITGFAGGSDLMARVVAQRLSPALNQQVYVEQRLAPPAPSASRLWPSRRRTATRCFWARSRW